MIKDKNNNWDNLGCNIKYGTFYFPKLGCISAQINELDVQQQFNNIFSDVYEW